MNGSSNGWARNFKLLRSKASKLFFRMKDQRHPLEKLLLPTPKASAGTLHIFSSLQLLSGFATIGLFMICLTRGYSLFFLKFDSPIFWNMPQSTMFLKLWSEKSRADQGFGKSFGACEWNHSWKPKRNTLMGSMRLPVRRLAMTWRPTWHVNGSNGFRTCRIEQKLSLSTAS